MTPQLFGLEILSRFMWVKTAKVFVYINVYFAVALRKMKIKWVVIETVYHTREDYS